MGDDVEADLTPRRGRLAWLVPAAFALSAATLVLTLPSLFDAPEQWHRGLAAASGGLSVLLGIVMVRVSTRRRDLRR
ncbi:hypothetical protein [Phycicoccus sonneratiae]|uniref:Uncharacterized protein n=1 Tax=Phycicoccus sonneratiae TaxID=2807628 RepID=A0ABS2CH86_9MICO|nr:hypothetical protein [Phycicoccus sonneraticus]MBM6399242.1 hypothetical protein [Phycicoccus sonneraticus]